jgi:hypothetical protein
MVATEVTRWMVATEVTRWMVATEVTRWMVATEVTRWEREVRRCFSPLLTSGATNVGATCDGTIESMDATEVRKS